VNETSPRILVVDDDVDTVNLLRLVLQRAGYQVITATVWDEIINELRHAHELDQKIDLVILDLMMPVRSGFDVMLVLQVIMHPVPPVIFLTAKVGIDDRVKAGELGAAKFMTKPTTPEKLLLAVEEVLGEKLRK
jgi:DNA-binding response OmpR family regulator